MRVWAILTTCGLVLCASAARADRLVVRQGAEGERVIRCLVLAETEASYRVQLLVGKKIGRATFPKARVLRLERESAEANAALRARWERPDGLPPPSAAPQVDAPAPKTDTAPAPAPDPATIARERIAAAAMAARRRVDAHYAVLRTRTAERQDRAIAALDAAAPPEQRALVRAMQERVRADMERDHRTVLAEIDRLEARGVAAAEAAAARELQALAATYVARTRR